MRVLIVYFSFSGQTHQLIKHLIEGLSSEGVDVEMTKVAPARKLTSPFGSFYQMVRVMLSSLFSTRVEIKPVVFSKEQPDLIILAGPTWSYNPSGPILSFIDQYGKTRLADKKVMPLISCRAYWRLHHLILQRALGKTGAKPLPPLIFSHPAKEPWSTIGVSMQVLGRLPRDPASWFRKKYPLFGHSKRQMDEAKKVGEELAIKLKNDLL